MTVSRGETNLYVRDLDKSARFYESALALRILANDPEDGDEIDYRKLQGDGFVLTLFKCASQESAATTGSIPMMTNDFTTREFDMVVRRLKMAGATVADIQEWSGGRFTMFQDPDGISWELIEKK